MDIQLGNDLSITWSTFIGVAGLAYVVHANWPLLRFAFLNGGGITFRVAFLAGIISVGTAFLYALLRESVSLEIARAFVWWLGVLLAYGFVSGALSALAQLVGTSYKKEIEFGNVGFLVGALIGILFAIYQANRLFGLTIGGWIGLIAALLRVRAGVAYWFSPGFAERREQQVIEERQQRLVPKPPRRRTLRGILQEYVFVLLVVLLVPALFATVPGLLQALSLGGLPGMVHYVDRLPTLLRSSAMNSARLLPIVIPIVAVGELFQLVLNKRSHHHSQ